MFQMIFFCLFLFIEIYHKRMCSIIPKIISALNGRDKITRSSIFMIAILEINLVCVLFLA